MSIKITPDKYPQIIEVYNTEGKTAAYDLMRSCYEIKNPTCVMKRMKADKSLGYNYDTDRFESDSRKEDDIFLNFLFSSPNKGFRHFISSLKIIRIGAVNIIA